VACGIVSRVPGLLEKSSLVSSSGAAHGSFSALSGPLECLMLALGEPIELKPGVFNWLEVKGQRL